MHQTRLSLHVSYNFGSTNFFFPSSLLFICIHCLSFRLVLCVFVSSCVLICDSSALTSSFFLGVFLFLHFYGLCCLSSLLASTLLCSFFFLSLMFLTNISFFFTFFILDLFFSSVEFFSSLNFFGFFSFHFFCFSFPPRSVVSIYLSSRLFADQDVAKVLYLLLRL